MLALLLVSGLALALLLRGVWRKLGDYGGQARPPPWMMCVGQCQCLRLALRVVHIGPGVRPVLLVSIRSDQTVQLRLPAELQ